MHRILLWLAALAITVAADTSRAEEPGPEETVAQYFSTLQQRGINDVAHLIHPDELSTFREMVFPLIVHLAASPESDMLESMFGTTSVDDISVLPPVDFMNSFMNIAVASGVAIVFDSYKILGVIPEMEERHVLVRHTILADERSIESLEVISVRKYGEAWMATLTGDIKAYGEQIQAQFGQ